MPSHEVTALTVRPGPRSLFNATRIADRSADPVHYPRWVREASPETDLTFGALPATANTAYGVLAPTAPLPAFLSNIRRLPQPDDPQAAAQLAAAVQQDVVMVPRLLAPNAGDIGSHLARIPNVTREPRAAPPPPRRLAGFDAFQVQFNTAKMKNQIDGRGQFFDPTDG
ncbi:hypothetical protein PsYK624_019350 [Phanerochaete sordida]|uniref:Uncharacterized protein n=1 Tax=Phanerochaete sordida TaxID=48140 RepID=A0A9P3L893_9APHY|nr:hypothetical protein PsYK624_019350 [Phanerochaete sordida]